MSVTHCVCHKHEFKMEKISYQQHVQTSPHSENHLSCFEMAHKQYEYTLVYKEPASNMKLCRPLVM